MYLFNNTSHIMCILLSSTYMYIYLVNIDIILFQINSLLLIF